MYYIDGCTLGELLYSSKCNHLITLSAYFSLLEYIFSFFWAAKMFMAVEFDILCFVLSFGPSIKPFCSSLCQIGHPRMASGSSRHYLAIFAISNAIFHLLLMKFFILEFSDGGNCLIYASFFLLGLCYFFQLQ